MTNPPMMYEMLRSFVVLAGTLNVSKAADELGLTRQTIKRHIQILQSLKGKDFFNTDGRAYSLTEDGERELVEVQTLLGQLDVWLDEEIEYVNGLSANRFKIDGADHWNQRHPLDQIWKLAPPLLHRGMECWSEGQAMIEHPGFAKIRPYMVVFRKVAADWICVEVGDQSSYATWLGATWAKSAVGSKYFSNHANSKIDGVLLRAYENVSQNGSLWYDHVSTSLTRYDDTVRHPVNYQRLLMSLRFPDGQGAVGVLVCRTNKISISGLPQEKLPLLPPEELMDFDI